MKADFFTPLDNTHPYIKVAFLGLAGSGKSCTAGKLAGGLHKHAKLTEPVVLFDTEASAKFFAPMFKEYGIPCLVKPSRTLADLRETMQYANEHGNILIIDSITHVWENFIQSYMEKKNRTRLQFQDWGVLKPQWKREFSDRFVMGKFHGIFTGRQGDIFEYVDVDGQEELRKTGIKMQSEKETAYEPDLLVNMERIQDISKDPMEIVHRGLVMKDRTMDPKVSMDGKVIRNPSFKDFLPYVTYVLQGKQVDSRLDTDTEDSELIRDEEQRNDARKQADIWRERVYALLDKYHAGTKKEDKQARLELTEHAFMGETSELAISAMTAETVETAYYRLKDKLEPQEGGESWLKDIEKGEIK